MCLSEAPPIGGPRGPGWPFRHGSLPNKRQVGYVDTTPPRLAMNVAVTLLIPSLVAAGLFLAHRHRTFTDFQHRSRNLGAGEKCVR